MNSFVINNLVINKFVKISLTLLFSLLIQACGATDKNSSSDNKEGVVASSTTEVTSTNSAVIEKPTIGAPDIKLFLEGALASPAKIVDCTLSNGAESSCYQLTIVGNPVDQKENTEIYCPSSINATAEEGGLWFDGSGKVYDVDGEFISNLAKIYDNKRWQMFNADTGEVTVIKGALGCEIAGDPRADPGYDNFCLECPLSALDGGVQKTVLIPVIPQAMDSVTRIRREEAGVAFNGVLFGPPAPVELILSSFTLGVFDDCGAHANPHDGYHYHGATGCAEIVKQSDGHSAQMGIAMDGYGMYARLNAKGELTETLDECGGTTDATRGYHYHVGEPGSNRILGCFKGAQGGIKGAKSRGGPPRGGPRDGPPRGGPPPEKSE